MLCCVAIGSGLLLVAFGLIAVGIDFVAASERAEDCISCAPPGPNWVVGLPWFLVAIALLMGGVWLLSRAGSSDHRVDSDSVTWSTTEF